VGLANFAQLFSSGSRLAATFWPVLGWTLIWAVCATFSNFILGMLLALLINRKGTRIKGFWRFLFVLSIAVPQFVTLLSMSTIFNANGPVNIILRTLGLIGATESVPFFTNALYAKCTIIGINMWIGIPYTMLSTTGILQNIPSELYEAARIDGAKPPTIFRKITLPYMMFVMTPTLITSFTGNINNFNVIYLLTGGGPDSLDYYFAGKTDLLITWLYRLTITQKDYNIGAVIGIMTFIVLAVTSLLTYHQTGAYKDEGAFQ
jgi:arabinogalactan oligomer/maltooligosaccharide transport system permease protein